MRIALDIDDSVLKEVTALHDREGRSMGVVVSDKEAVYAALCAGTP